MPSILVATGFVRIDADASKAKKALQSFGAVGSAALTSTLLPAAAAASAALLSVASAAAAAGAAAAVYGAAVAPQFKAITSANQKLEASQKATEKSTLSTGVAQKLAKQYGFEYGKQVQITSKMTATAKAHAQEYNKALSAAQSATKSASQSQALYKQEMAAMPPATRATANALQGLKDESKKWSDSLASSTMPVFTHGIDMLRGLLPKLTPLVRNVAQELDGFTNSLRMGVAGQVFQQFGHNVQTNGAGALRTFLNVIKNITVGFVGLLNTFMPASKGVTGGLEAMTEKFALWGATSQNSPGLKRLMDTAKGSVPAFAALARAIGEVVSAAGPMSGVGLKVLTVFAKIIDAIPTPVLRLLVPAILAVNLSLKAYTIYQAAAAAATWAFTTSVTASTGTVYTSRAVLLVHRIALIATAAATAATTAATWLWTAATTAASFAMTVLRGVVLGLRYALVLVRIAAAATALGFRLLAIAIISNPIALIITALVVLAGVFYLLWKRSETFRNIVTAALNGVKIAAMAVGGWFAGPFVQFFVSGYNKLNKYVFQPIGWFFTVGLPRAASIGKALTVGWVLGLYNGMLSVYRGMKTYIFNPIGNFFTKTIPGWASTMNTKVRGFFISMRDGIGSIMHGIESKAKTPINWVLDHVWNRGIVNIWGKIAGWIGLDNNLKPVKLLASGGTVGRAQPGVFNRPTAIVGEGNPRYPEYVIPTDPKYAKRAKGLWHAAGAHFYEDGGILGSIGSAIKSAAGKVGSVVKGAADFFSDPLGKAKGLLMGPLKSLNHVGNSPWGKMAAKLPRMAVDGLLKAVKSVGGDLLGAVGLGSGDGGSGVSRWRGIVQVLLRMLGQPLGYTDLTLRRMNQESGGNPTIVNKWDSNWQAGHPSVGLMQVIGPTFRSYAGKYRNTGPFLYGVSVNPAANIYSSMKYALAAYGSLPRAYNRAGGYRNGTSGTSGGVHMFGEAGPELGFSPAGWRILNARRTAGLVGGAGLTVGRLVIENHGVIASQREAEDWLVRSIDTLRKKKRL